MIKDVNTNTATQTTMVDLHGLNDEQAAVVELEVRNQTKGAAKRIVFLR